MKQVNLILSTDVSAEKVWALLADFSGFLNWAGGGARIQGFNSGVQKFEVSANSSTYFIGGNVGIGTSSPNQKLDVSGVTRSHKMEIQSSSSDATFLNIVQQAGGVDSRIDLKTSANNGGDPFIFFDAGGSNMVVGNHWSGTTNNQLRPLLGLV